MAPKNDTWLEGYVITLWGIVFKKKGIYNMLNLTGKKHLAESKNENIPTKLHPKIVQTLATIKQESEVSDLKGKSADSKICCIETRNVFQNCD
ncbi:hypothetical protein TNCV_4445561 [Trichonephila clavipes]|nr:hypothetical protein TNCV_4445561 [Trichonephila clavipes]